MTFSGGERVETTPLTLIVGPNNAGKSRALRELLERLLAPQPPANHRVVSEIDISPPATWPELRDSIVTSPRHVADDTNIYRSQTLGSNLTGTIQVALGTESSHLAFTQTETYITGFGQASVAYLGTQQRLQLMASTAVIPPPPMGEPTNIVQYLFHRRDLEELVNTEIDREFQTRIHVDWSNLAQLVVRVGSDVDCLSADPFVAALNALQYEQLDVQGDGVRSYAATVAAAIVARRPVMLVDEPETSLHPPQAFALGRFFGRNFDPRHQLVASTHSADILRGVLSTPAQLTLIRLTRVGDVNHAVSISADDLRAIANDPLLNASSILDALFFSGAVVTEADADRAFYEEISAKLLPSSPIRFTSVQGKHTLSRAVRAYRRMGVPFAAIADIDVLREEPPFQALVGAATDDPELTERVTQLRARFIALIHQATAEQRLASMEVILRQINDAVAEAVTVEQKVQRVTALAPRITRDSDAWKRLKEGGVSNMTDVERAAFAELSTSLAHLGIFVVPVGELEWWLTCVSVGASTDKRAWIGTALPLARSLEANEQEGPWPFVASIHMRLLGR
jgi:putative AbiEii toxin of type IV toxin-antitoxin system/OLD-like protein